MTSDALFLIHYRDGLKAVVGMFDSVGECFGFTCRRRGASAADSAVFDLENVHPFGHFGYMLAPSSI